MKKIRGIAWDHPRGYQPLQAASKLWKQQHEQVEITWHIRSLQEFGDYPIEKLYKDYDLILVDHPYMGEAAENGIFVPLNQHLSADFLNLQAKESVGPSFRSYQFNEDYWALPIDAAAQVASYRKDVIEKLKLQLPQSLSEIKDFAQSLPTGQWVGVPLCPTDIWCVLLSLCAQFSKEQFFTAQGIAPEIGENAVEEIKSWLAFLHPQSLQMNPIQMLDIMGSENSIVYVPFIFGYTNYSRAGWSKYRLHFTDVPLYQPHTHSSLLGGVGIAVSSQSGLIEEALSFVEFVLSPAIQQGLYYHNGGQPAHLSAWKDKGNNEDCAGFFINTLSTLKNAYVRPQHKGFNRFQEKASYYLHTAIREKIPGHIVIRTLNEMYKTSI